MCRMMNQAGQGANKASKGCRGTRSSVSKRSWSGVCWPEQCQDTLPVGCSQLDCYAPVY